MSLVVDPGIGLVPQDPANKIHRRVRITIEEWDDAWSKAEPPGWSIESGVTKDLTEIRYNALTEHIAALVPKVVKSFERNRHHRKKAHKGKVLS